MSAPPQQPPFRFVDRVVTAAGGEAVAELAVCAADCVAGVLPDLVVLEALAQACACATGAAGGAAAGRVVSLRAVRFEGAARAGDRLSLKVRRLGGLGDGVVFEATAEVAARAVARAEIGVVHSGTVKAS
jgi:3-hydroxymyristoyl/3-hydroxydecanoyl-(acyl carrier protein) dehydratase